MKKSILFILFGLIFVLTLSALSIPKQYIVEPDPDNPLQGTWISFDGRSMQVIEGMNGTWYVLTKGLLSYKVSPVNPYQIEKTEDGYAVGDQKIIVSGDRLIIGGVTFERYKK
jgi:hypothetical protein